MDEQKLEKLQTWVKESSRIVFFGGAGVSTESGIPDFRGEDGLYRQRYAYPPETIISHSFYVRHPEIFFDFYRNRMLYPNAKPNVVHQRLAQWERDGKLLAVVTQNIDGLHQASGIAEDGVIELHGNGTYATCLTCGRRHELAAIRPVFEATGEPPSCTICAGPVKSATISFGQAMPQEAMKRAQMLALECDLFLVVGSSLVVYPAATLPVIAKRQGAKLVILNREPTELDPIADLVIRAESGAVLGALQR